MTERDWKILLNTGELVTFSRDQKIISKGEKTSYFYRIKSGRVKILSKEEEQEIQQQQQQLQNSQEDGKKNQKFSLIFFFLVPEETEKLFRKQDSLK